MKWEELNAVVDLDVQIKQLERQLTSLRASSTSITPLLNGMPKSSGASSKVEKIVTLIMDLEKELCELKTQKVQSMARLEAMIADVTVGKARELFTLRYVYCQLFRDIAFKLNCSENKIYYLHRITLEKIVENI